MTDAVGIGSVRTAAVERVRRSLCHRVCAAVGQTFCWSARRSTASFCWQRNLSCQELAEAVVGDMLFAVAAAKERAAEAEAVDALEEFVGERELGNDVPHGADDG